MVKLPLSTLLHITASEAIKQVLSFVVCGIIYLEVESDESQVKRKQRGC